MSNSINVVQVNNYALLVLTSNAMKGFYTFYKDKGEIVINDNTKPEIKKIFGIEYSSKSDILPYKERLKLCMDEGNSYKSPLYEKIKGYNNIANITHKNGTGKSNEIIYHLDYDLYEKLVKIGSSSQPMY